MQLTDSLTTSGAIAAERLPPPQPSQRNNKSRSLGPQGVALATRLGENAVIMTLKQHYFTSSEGEIPSHKKYSHKHRPVAINQHTHLPISNNNNDESNVAQEAIVGRALDGFLLLEASGMNLPDDGRSITLVEGGFTSVVEEDLNFFTGLEYLDLSENNLPLEPFATLPELVELRLTCNGVQNIMDLGYMAQTVPFCFDKLLRLDLSYNSLTTHSVQALDALPCLKELDLCGNDLRALPVDMFRFKSLEKLMLNHNKFDDNTVFLVLSCIPSLRHLSLAYNYLFNIPYECCGDSFFRLLDLLDISFNYFGSEDSIKPIINLPRLDAVQLYGNPLLGPTGEDSLQTYIEDLVDEALEIRLKQGKKQIEFITEVPTHRNIRRLKKDQPFGRLATYKDFSIVQVDAKVYPKSSREWRTEGNKTLFAEAVAAARNGRQQAGLSNAKEPDYTFITGGGSIVSDTGTGKMDDLYPVGNNIAEEIMERVAEEMGIGNGQSTSAELLLLRDLSTMPSTVAGRAGHEDDEYMNHNENIGSSQHQHQHHHQNTIPTTETIPASLFSKNFGEGDTELESHPVPLHTAVRALRFALKNPLSNHSEVPAKGFLPPKGYVQPTAASVNRRLPRKQDDRDLLDEENRKASLEYLLDLPNRPVRGLPEPEHGRSLRDARRHEALGQIEEVLSGLNESTQKHTGSGSGPGNQGAQMKDFARPTTALKGLLSMVDEVIKDLDG